MDNWIKTVTVGGEKYDLELCSAQQQWSIVKLFMKYGLTDALYQITTGKKSLALPMLFGQLMKHATDSEIDNLTEMLIGKCTKQGKKTPIQMEDFHCNMYLFIDLQLHAIKENFADFTPFLSFQEGAEDQEETPASTGS